MTKDEFGQLYDSTYLETTRVLHAFKPAVREEAIQDAALSILAKISNGEQDVTKSYWLQLCKNRAKNIQVRDSRPHRGMPAGSVRDLEEIEGKVRCH